MNKGKKKIITTLTYFFMGLLILSAIALSYSIYLYKGIETFYRVLVILIIIYITTVLSFAFITALKREKFKRFLISSILSVIFISLFCIGTYYIYTLYHKINKFNKDTVTYTSILLTFNEDYKKLENIKNAKIGIIDDSKNYESNILALEVIEKNKLESKNEIIKLSSALELMSALYNKEVDLIFINGNYVELFSSLEEYKDVEEKAIEVVKHSKNYQKKKIEDENNKSSDKLLTEPFTILLLGVDSEKNGLDKNAAFNGDTIMLISFNPQTLQATMFSIPRDTYVPITCSGNALKKINTSAYGGTSCVINTVKKLTGISIDYYVKINFKGVTQLVDAIGGVSVDVPMDFCEQNSDRNFGNQTICLKTGVQKLNGEQALALARHRKTLPLGDYQRGQNQQLVIEGILNQGKSIKSVSKVYEILDTVSNNIDTNLSTKQMLSFYEVLKSLVFSENNNILNIQKTFLRGYDMYVYEAAAGGSRYAFFNWKGSLDEITDAMKVNLGIKEAQIIKEFTFSINEIYERKIIGDKTYSESKLAVVPNFSSYTIESVKSWANEHGLSFSVVDYATKEEVSSHDDYMIVDQKEHAQTLVSRIDSITIYVVKNASQQPTENETVETEETPTEEIE